MKRLQAIFITGCLVLVPVLLTVQLILWLVQSVDSSIRTLFPQSVMPFDFKGLGVLVAVSLIFFTGLMTQLYIGKWLIAWFDRSVRRISFVGGIYGSFKKFLETFLQPGNDRFKGTVLVPFPREGIYSIGFRTGKPDAKLLKNGRDLANIFVPCTPNPTSGFYLLVPESDLVPLDLSVQEAFKIVISMGLVKSDE